jgi:hypothetical protein
MKSYSTLTLSILKIIHVAKDFDEKFIGKMDDF